MSLGHVRPSLFIMSLLAGAISLSACQQKAEPEPNVDDSMNTEEAVPMSAEPADPNVIALALEDPIEDEVADDTVATVNTGVTQITYLCTPELKIQATYEDEAVIVATDRGTLTLSQTNEGSNPEVYEGTSGIDGSEGFTQWRVANKERATGVMRLAGADETNVTTYECKKTN